MRVVGRDRESRPATATVDQNHTIVKGLLRVVASVGPVSGVGLVIATANSKQGFSWDQDTLSSLMDKDTGKERYLFQVGTVGAGITTALLAAVRKSDHDGCIVSLLGLGAIAATAAALAGTGLTNGSRRRFHGRFAYALFISGPGALVLEGLEMMMHGSRALGSALTAAGISAAAIALANREGNRLPAKPEAIHAALISVGGLMIGTAKLMPARATVS